MKGLVVVGIHTQYAGSGSIDRFDRRIYLSEAVTSYESTNGHELEERCLEAVESWSELCEFSPSELSLALVHEGSLSTSERLVTARSFASLAQVWVDIESLGLPAPLLGVFGLAVSPPSTLTNNTLSFDQAFEGYGSAEGLAGILLCEKATAVDRGWHIYAEIEGSVGTGVAETCARAQRQAGISPERVYYVECSSLAQEPFRSEEARGLAQGYRTDGPLRIALGGLRSVTGEGGSFSQVAGLVKTILAAYQHYVPGTAGWNRPQFGLWEDTGFYVPMDSRPAYSPQEKHLLAAYSCQTEFDYVHFVVQGPEFSRKRPNGFLACSDWKLVVFKGHNPAELKGELQALARALRANADWKVLAQEAWEKAKAFSGAVSTLCLVADSAEHMLQEIDQASLAVDNPEGEEWKTPRGSYFTTKPAGGAVTFVYPGIGATYVGLGRDLFHLFPEIYPLISALTDNLGSSLKESVLNPRSLSRLSPSDLKLREHEFRNHLPTIAEAGVGYACVYTKLFEHVFGLKADYAFGYSMGEISMFAALGSWVRPGEMSETLAHSDTFNRRLNGELLALQEQWSLEDHVEGPLWETYTLKTTPERFLQAAAGEQRVYCTLINTPDNIVVGGYPPDCLRVFEKLGVRAFPMDMQNAIHSPPATADKDAMEKLFHMPVEKKTQTKIYSSSCYLPIPQFTKSVAVSIAKCLTEQVDFPKLVEAVYREGARVFLEMGPGGNLCHWIDKILKSTHQSGPSVTAVLNARGARDETVLLRALAKLVSHGVNLDLSRLFTSSLIVANQRG